MLEFDHNQNALDFDSDLSEASGIQNEFALTRIGSGSTSESFCYDRRGNQIASFADGNLKRTIRYSSFDAATSIVSNFPRAHVTRFQYGIGHQRLRRYDIDGTNAVENSQGQVTHSPWKCWVVVSLGMVLLARV